MKSALAGKVGLNRLYDNNPSPYAILSANSLTWNTGVDICLDHMKTRSSSFAFLSPSSLQDVGDGFFFFLERNRMIKCGDQMAESVGRNPRYTLPYIRGVSIQSLRGMIRA